MANAPVDDRAEACGNVGRRHGQLWSLLRGPIDSPKACGEDHRVVFEAIEPRPPGYVMEQAAANSTAAKRRYRGPGAQRCGPGRQPARLADRYRSSWQ